MEELDKTKNRYQYFVSYNLEDAENTSDQGFGSTVFTINFKIVDNDTFGKLNDILKDYCMKKYFRDVNTYIINFKLLQEIRP